MAETIKVLTEGRGPISFSQLSEAQGTSLFTITASAITATPDWQGKMVRFTGACTVTLPSTLPADFSCGWSQDGANAVTFVAGAGATIQSLGGNLSSAGQYSMGGIAGISAGTFRLYGQLSA